MKAKLAFITICYLLSNISFPSFAQGTAFTYQGRLQNNGSPANGSYNLTLSLFNVSRGGTADAGPATTNGVRDDKGVSKLELDGVELAAIQGLNQKLDKKDAEFEQLKQSIAQLQSLVAQLAKAQSK